MEKKEKKIYNPFSIKNALLTSIAISTLIHVLLFFVSYLNFTRADVLTFNTLRDVLISITGAFLQLFFMFTFCFYFIQKTWTPFKKYFIAFFGLLILTIILSVIFNWIYSFTMSNQAFRTVNMMYKNLMINFLYALIVALITTSIHVMVQNQKIVSESIRNRYEALKNQLDPHFLFNSLNTLDGLIGYDDEKAHNYLQNLSYTFRHTIQNKEIAELSEELKFLDAYVYLMKIRYGDNFRIDYQIDDKYRSYLILHVSLQLLVENAIKHNTADDKHQLFISVETTSNSSIKVTNNKNPKIEEEWKEKGIGLGNLAERYRLLFNKKIKIEDSDHIFSVEIPLIKHVSEEKTNTN